MTFAFLPNAIGPPHLGHFYHVLLLRAARDFYRFVYDRRGLTDWQIRWELWSDCHYGYPARFSEYEQMLKWMQMPPDATRHLQAMGPLAAHLFIPKHEHRFDEHSPTALKLFGFDMLEVRHIIRGWSPEMNQMSINEHDLSRCIGTNYPSTHQSPVLKDEDGEPIDAQASSSDYDLDFSMDYESVLQWFLDSQMIHDEGWQLVLRDIPDFPFLMRTADLLRVGKAHFDIARIRNNVPRNWKEQCNG